MRLCLDDPCDVCLRTTLFVVLPNPVSPSLPLYLFVYGVHHIVQIRGHVGRKVGVRLFLPVGVGQEEEVEHLIDDVLAILFGADLSVLKMDSDTLFKLVKFVKRKDSHLQ